MKLYTTKELQSELNIGKNTVYKLVKLKGFPKIQIGKRILIPKEEFAKWIKDNIGDKINL